MTKNFPKNIKTFQRKCQGVFLIRQGVYPISPSSEKFVMKIYIYKLKNAKEGKEKIYYFFIIFFAYRLLIIAETSIILLLIT